MHLDLLDLLRCPAGHEDTPLVSAVSRVEDRVVVEAMIGCPVCHARYRVEDAHLVLGDSAADSEDAPAAATADDDEVMRLAALLGLTEPGGLVVLASAWAPHAKALTRLVPMQVVVLDAPALRPSGTVSTVLAAPRLPFAPRSVRGVALDERMPEGLRRSAVEGVRPRGRVVGPVALPVPDGLTELARDDRHWVAESPARTTSGIVQLRRR